MVGSRYGGGERWDGRGGWGVGRVYKCDFLCGRQEVPMGTCLGDLISLFFVTVLL